MKTTSQHGTVRKLLAATLAAALMLAAPSAGAWGPWGPVAGGWDPHEAYLDEYGYLDRYGPTPGDIRRMQRDSWRAAMGYPVRMSNVGLYGPTTSDVIRQHHRKTRRLWGYGY